MAKTQPRAVILLEHDEYAMLRSLLNEVGRLSAATRTNDYHYQRSSPSELFDRLITAVYHAEAES